MKKQQAAAYYDPKTVRYPYPEDTDRHYLVVKKDDGTVFDRYYPYIDRSKGFLFCQFLVRVVLNIVVFPVMRIRLGLKVRGKEKLKEHREELKKGVISVANHVHMWDYLALRRTVRPANPYILSWAPNIRGENGTLIRMTGGIPIPENDLRATAAYVKAVQGLLESGGWLHVYAEGSMWEYYRPIRPFKRGPAFFACRFDKPVLPFAFSFRKPGFIREKIFHQTACLTLNVGEPLYPDTSLDAKEREEDLTRRAHEAVCRLAGFKEGENLYPPVYDDSKRIDYYTEEYGIGYKGSW